MTIEEMMNFTPSNQQRDVAKAIDWLINDDAKNRGQGRSTAIIWRYIRYAMAHPEKRIYINDFHSAALHPYHRIRFLESTATFIAKMHPDLGSKFQVFKSDFSILYIGEFHDNN